MIKQFLNIVCAIFLCALATSCTKESDFEKQQGKDQSAIAQYLTSNNLTSTKYSSGLHQVIPVTQEGTGALAGALSVVEVNAVMYLLDGKKVNELKNYVFKPGVGSFLYGLTEAVQKMKKGGKSRFLLPSTLAFGGASGTLGDVYVPANSNLVMDVELVDVRTDAEQQVYEDNLIKAYIAKNKLTVTAQKDGVYYIATVPSFAPEVPKTGASTTVNYKGTVLSDGSQFDIGTNFTFVMGSSNLISGWNIGVSMMKEGEKGLVIIPSHLAYGAQGVNGKIAPYEPLIFEMELKKV